MPWPGSTTANTPAQIAALEVDGVAQPATARTLPRLTELKERYE